MNTTSTANKTTLASIVKNILSNTTDGVTVKEALVLAEAQAKEIGLTTLVNYRAVYQQLRAQGDKLTKGKFISKQSFVEGSSEVVQEEVAA